MIHSLRKREEQGQISRAWEHEFHGRGYESLTLNGAKLLKRVHREAVTCIDLDRVENRYLLSGGADASIAIFDTQQPPTPSKDPDLHEAAPPAPGAPSSWREAELQPALLLDRSSRDAHRFLVSAVCWYPVDTGLFVTGSYDKTIRVWDTNCQELVSTFSFPARVTCLSMSPVATTHCLIAGSCQEQHVRLCDPSSGALTHTLSGHREAVWTVAWSLRSEFELVSGDSCGQIRVWDIRRSGCVRVLDQYCTTAAAASKWQQLPGTFPAGSRPLGAAAAALAAAMGETPVPRVGSRQRAATSASLLHSGAGMAMNGVREALASGKRRRDGDVAPQPIPGPADKPQPDLASSVHKAHQGAVTCIVPSPDGLHWLSTGTDCRLRLWDAFSWHNRLVSYPETHNNRLLRCRRLAVSGDGRAVFHPVGNDVQVFAVHTGHVINSLKQGHYGAVNCCMHSSSTLDLFSGGDDGQILVWSPKQIITAEDEDKA